MNSIFRGSDIENQDVLIVNECLTKKQNINARPMANSYGSELNKILYELGVSRVSSFNIINAYNGHPPAKGGKDYFFGIKQDIKKDGYINFENQIISKKFFEDIQSLRDEVSSLPNKPGIIITLGDAALFAVTGEVGIDRFRGSMLEGAGNFEGIRVLPTHSISRMFKQWPLRKLVSHDLRRAFMYRDKPWPKPSFNFVTGTDLDKLYSCLDEVYERAARGDHISVDIETRYHKHISCIGFAWSKRDALCVPIIRGGLTGLWWGQEVLSSLVDKIRKIFECENVRISGQNFQYDAQYLARDWGIVPKLWRDSMVLQHIFLSGGLPKDLNTLSSLYNDYHIYWKDEGKGHDVTEEQEQAYWDYNCKDAVATWEIVENQLKYLIEPMGLDKPTRFQHRLWPYVVKCNMRGINDNTEYRLRVKRETQEKIVRLENFMKDIIPPSIRPLKGKDAKAEFYSSPKQLMQLLYDIFDIKPHTKRTNKKWKRSVEDEGLRLVMKREPLLKPLCEAILAYRSLCVALTFLDANLDHDGRWRCSYGLAGTTTYRFSSKSDAFDFGRNLQNLFYGDE